MTASENPPTASPNAAEPLESIGFGGDGDEVAAIEAVEAHFGVTLDVGRASQWRTAGDVFAALLDAAGPERGGAEAMWPDFARIMCDETGVDPARLAPETLLLGVDLRTQIGRWLKGLAARWR